MKTNIQNIDSEQALIDFYEAFLKKHFRGIEPACALELLMGHGWQMTDKQKKALNHFIGLWELVVEDNDF